MHTRRTARFVLSALAVTLSVGALLPSGAGAQYGGNDDDDDTTDTTDTTDAPPTTDTTLAEEEETTTTTVNLDDLDLEESVEKPAQLPLEAQSEANVGAAVPVSATFGQTSEDPLPAGAQVSVAVKPATAGSTPVFLATATVNGDGSVTIDVRVPPSDGDQSGVYLIFIVLPEVLNSDGTVARRARVAVASIVIKDTTAKASAAQDVAPYEPDLQAVAFAKSTYTVGVAEIVEGVAAQVRDAGDDLIAAVADGAEMSIVDGQLLVHDSPIDPDDSSGRGLAAAVSLGAAAAGLIVIRRRSLAGANR